MLGSVGACGFVPKSALTQKEGCRLHCSILSLQFVETFVREDKELGKDGVYLHSPPAPEMQAGH